MRMKNPVSKSWNPKMFSLVFGDKQLNITGIVYFTSNNFVRIIMDITLVFYVLVYALFY